MFLSRKLTVTLASCLFVGATVVASVSGGPPSPRQGGVQAKSQTTDKTSNAKPDDPKPDTEAPANDKSLTVAEYLKLGLPAQDKTWTGTEMEKAFKALAAVAQKDFAQLPRFQSKQSGEVFARITTPENLAYFRNRELPITTRLPQAITYYNYQNQFLALYLQAYQKKTIAGNELMELIGTLSRSSLLMFELSDEMLASIPKDDPTYKARLEGLGKMKNGLATFFTGSFQTLGEKDGFTAAERRRLLGHLKETGPALWQRLTPESQVELLKRLEGMAKDDKLKDLQPDLNDLLAALKKGDKKEEKKEEKK